MGDHLDQNLLGVILGVLPGPRHPQGQSEHRVLDSTHNPLKGLLIPVFSLSNPLFQM